jgi:exopolysaccharide biosynthesis polyprenyl glycosylphosphotransferase
MRAPDTAQSGNDTVVERPLASVTRLEVPAVPRASRPAAWFLFCDIGLALIALGIAFLIRGDLTFSGLAEGSSVGLAWSIPAVITVTLAIFYALGLYEREILALRALHLLAMAKALLWSAAIGALLVYILELPIGLESRLIAVPAFALFFFVAGVLRTTVLSRELVPRWRDDMGGTLVVGWPYRTEPLRERLHMLKGFDNVTLVDVGRDERVTAGVAAELKRRRNDGRPVYGSLFIDAGSLSTEQTLDLISTGRRNGAAVYVVSNRLRPLAGRRLLIDLFEAPVVRVYRVPGEQGPAPAKRVLDIAGAAVGLILLSPLMLTIAVAVKLGSHGPVFYAQERIGRGGKPFKFYKFRSMKTGADHDIHSEYMVALINGEAETKTQTVEGETENVFKLVDDPRVTGVGRLIRRYSLDELPQLWNVLIGDMSLVGPRPPLPYEVSAYQPWHRRRLDIKPGITGVWQVDGRSKVSFDDMVFQDILYDAARDLLIDTSLCLRTVPAALLGHGAA